MRAVKGVLGALTIRGRYPANWPFCKPMCTGEWSGKGPVPLPRRNILTLIVIILNSKQFMNIYFKILLGELGLGEIGRHNQKLLQAPNVGEKPF